MKNESRFQIGAIAAVVMGLMSPLAVQAQVLNVDVSQAGSDQRVEVQQENSNGARVVVQQNDSLAPPPAAGNVALIQQVNVVGALLNSIEPSVRVTQDGLRNEARLRQEGGTGLTNRAEAVINQNANLSVENRVGSGTDARGYFLQKADDNLLDLTQRGNSEGSWVRGQQLGSRNVIDSIQSGNHRQVRVEIDQQGSRNNATFRQTSGENNVSDVVQSGERNRSNTTQTGGARNTIEVEQSAVSNVSSVTQRGASSMESTASVTQTGDGGSVVTNALVTQVDTMLSSVEVIQSGENYQATVTQENGERLSAKVVQGGAGNVMVGSQSMGRDLSYDLTQSGVGNDARITQTGSFNDLVAEQSGNNNRLTSTQSGNGLTVGNMSTIEVTQLGGYSAVLSQNTVNSSIKLMQR